MKNSRRLPDSVKRFIVQQLAWRQTPSQVARAVKEELGAIVPRNQIQCYDPTCATGAKLSPRLKQLFEAMRRDYDDAYQRAVANIGVAHKAVRLRKLDRMATIAEESGNVLLAAKLLEQAARELGGTLRELYLPALRRSKRARGRHRRMVATKT